MNIDRSAHEFRDPDAPPPGPVGRAWRGIKRWSGRNPRLSRVVWFVVGLALLALLIWAIYPRPQKNLRFNQGPQPVGVAVAQDSDIDVTLNALGTVTPMATATVRPQVGGLLIKLNFTEGQMVKAGDVLAQIDPRPYQAALDQARGQLARDSATLANAKVDLQRYQALQAQNAIAQQQVATQAATVQSYQGVVVADQAAVETARINLGYTSVVSPISGRVGIHLVDIGNIVSAGQANGIVVVTQLQPMSVLFTVPEDNVRPVMARLGEGAKLQVDAYDRTQTSKIATGTLSTVDNVVDPSTGSVKMRAMFDNEDHRLFPAQFVNVRLLVNTLHHQTVVPVAAIQRGSDGSYVFVVTPEKTVLQRTVKTGVQDGDRIQIVDGLKAGDTVVVDGADRLRDGADVDVPDQSVKIAAPSENADDAARAARRAELAEAMNKSCSDDLKKLCPDAAAGSREMRTCLFRNRQQLSEPCSKALAQMRRGARAGGAQGGPRP
ncbi:MAG: efflux RND transporter periplasmic adaptor subunit [Alphaproteobacteria bacterium]|nr:efflux RND transporter periplasmic adaptor subunit [Alphaproteobacteria bacterium]